MALVLLCEFILNSTRTPPGEEFLYHTLLELHLMGDEDQNPGLPRFATGCQSVFLLTHDATSGRVAPPPQ